VSEDGKRKGLSSLYAKMSAFFCEFIFIGTAWTGPNRDQGLVPKDKGNGLMIPFSKLRVWLWNVSAPC
jgi:hypothetical protein